MASSSQMGVIFSYTDCLTDTLNALHPHMYDQMVAVWRSGDGATCKYCGLW